MAKKKKTQEDLPLEHDETQVEQVANVTENDQGDEKRITKAEAIRRVIAAMGGAEQIESNTSVINAVKMEYGFDVVSAEISIAKKKLLGGVSTPRTPKQPAEQPSLPMNADNDAPSVTELVALLRAAKEQGIKDLPELVESVERLVAQAGSFAKLVKCIDAISDLSKLV